MRWLAAMMGLMCALAVASASAAPPADPTEIVRALYARETARLAAGKPLSEPDLLEIVSADLRTLWQAGRGKADPRAPDGRLHDVYFGWGIKPGERIGLRRVEPLPSNGAGRVVMVDLTMGQDVRSVFVLLARDGARWAIQNIVYDGGEDFRVTRERLAGL